MPSSQAVFDLNYRKSEVDRHLRFCQFKKNSEVCHVGWVLFIKPWHHTLHISELKYAPTDGTFPSFLKFRKPQVPIHSTFTIIYVKYSARRRHFCKYSDTTPKGRHFLTGSDVIARSFSSSDCKIVLFFKPWLYHRAVSYRVHIDQKNGLDYMTLNFTEVVMNANKVNPENLVAVR